MSNHFSRGVGGDDLTICGDVESNPGPTRSETDSMSPSPTPPGVARWKKRSAPAYDSVSSRPKKKPKYHRGHSGRNTTPSPEPPHAAKKKKKKKTRNCDNPRSHSGRRARRSQKASAARKARSPPRVLSRSYSHHRSPMQSMIVQAHRSTSANRRSPRPDYRQPRHSSSDRDRHPDSRRHSYPAPPQQTWAPRSRETSALSDDRRRRDRRQAQPHCLPTRQDLCSRLRFVADDKVPPTRAQVNQRLERQQQDQKQQQQERHEDDQLDARLALLNALPSVSSAATEPQSEEKLSLVALGEKMLAVHSSLLSVLSRGGR